jgi:hypothetical protein
VSVREWGEVQIVLLERWAIMTTDLFVAWAAIATLFIAGISCLHLAFEDWYYRDRERACCVFLIAILGLSVSFYFAYLFISMGAKP